MLGFAQISDIHFGEVLANKNRGLWHRRPHDLAKCLQLPLALEAASSASKVKGDIKVAVTGDLTVHGSEQQFAVVHTYLRRKALLTSLALDEMGLGLQSENLAVIPGNHDHWRGSGLMPAYNPHLVPTHFEATPWMKTWDAEDFHVDIFGIDSNSGWESNPAAPMGRLAEGRLSDSHLLTLEGLLRGSLAAGGDRLRVIMCHHSLAYQGGILGRPALQQLSRDALLGLCTRFRVSVVLTGHTHDSNCSPIPWRGSGSGLIRELRCAATLCLEDKPNDERGFLFHRIERIHASGWQWKSARYGWDGSRFIPASQLFASFSGTF